MAPIGPVDDALMISSYGDYIRSYGGLQLDYPMSYAVQDFFENGGSQAVVARLFEPADDEGNGYAQLSFPPSPPLLPDGWMLDKAAVVGDTTLYLQGPDGTEAEPDLGMIVYLGGDKTQPYTITAYQQASAKAPANVMIVPNVQGPVNKSLPICTQLDFDSAPSPSGWVVFGGSGTNLTVAAGSGNPEVGERFSVPGDPVSYTISDQPTVIVTAGQLQLAIPFTPKPGSFPSFGTAVSFGPPQPSPMPLQWQIQGFTNNGAGKPGTLALLNGTGAPLPGDQFTVGSQTTLYVVQAFTPEVAGKSLAQLSFATFTGEPLPTDAKSFCFCCTLRFTRPVPAGWSIVKAPKINDIRFTVGRTSGTTGVIDVGHAFLVDGSDVVYTVRLLDPDTGTVTFLPEADAAFASSKSVTFSPPLQLIAASPGRWGNLLTATADNKGITEATARQFKAEFELDPEDLFNLTLIRTDANGRTLKTEKFLNVSVKTTGAAKHFPNRLDRVLLANSDLCRVSVLPGAPPSGAVRGRGGSDGTYLAPKTYIGDPDQNTGINLLNTVDMFNLLCIPPDRRVFDEVPLPEQDLDGAVRSAAAHYATDKRAIYIVDPPAAWYEKVRQGKTSEISPSDLGITGANAAGIEVARNAAVYFPRFVSEDVLLKGMPALFAPCGAVAGVIASTDASRGIWKAPAGMDAGLSGVDALEVTLTDAQQGLLNPAGINCLRTFPGVGSVVWGARTLRGADQFEDDYKYLPVRRLTLYIEDSLYRATQWAVFEPNDESLWSSLRLSVGGFLADLSRKGAFYNYYVLCDRSTTDATDIANGVVNITVGIAPVNPAEFIKIHIQQTKATAAS